MALKVFKRVIMSNLESIPDPLLDPMQFAYRANRSVDDAVNLGLHYFLQREHKRGTYSRILFVDF